MINFLTIYNNGLFLNRDAQFGRLYKKKQINKQKKRMLDTQTKKRIDDCRDILVGKLPDPKAQIEQITIGLIYKFMDDMDKEAIELGGKAKFFSNYTIPDPKDPEKKLVVEFEKYSWDKLFDSKVTATEMLTLYSEAIVGMDKNPNIPPLFRDIFKNAYLPYRDPETLKMFLKTICEFEYTHSEKLGDAFEYLLSVMGSQGDAGQFRTPRHIIDFMVAVVDPTISDTILDPACGTAGFLISAFKHIKEKNKNGLTPDERKKLIRNFTGYDISPDMVRLSLVNLYLHGFSDPHIWEYDTLSSEDRWKENFDVILANPPFMSPKGGIRPHKKFSISSNRSEVLFVDYIAEHLNPKGRAGIIVPEGVIFQSGTAYKDLRKMLVDNYLYAVVSLPAGVFNPYSGVKTSILLMDKEFAKTNDKILFVKVANDGYGLGAQRNAVKGGQLDDAIEIIKTFVETPNWASPPDGIAHAVQKSEIAKNGDYNLSGERYKVNDNLRFSSYEFVELKEICDVRDGTHDSPKYINEGFPLITSKNIKDGFIDFTDLNYITKEDFDKISQRSYVDNGDILMPMIGTIGNPIVVRKDREFAIKNVALIKFFNESRVNRYYLKEILASTFFNEHYKNSSSGSTQKFISLSFIRNLQIPLPPLSIQQEIVAEIEAYQKIIDGAKMVVENYKPKIDIDPEWEMMEFNSICTLEYGSSLPKENRIEGKYPVVGSNGITGWHNDFLIKGPAIVVGRKGSAGEVVFIDKDCYPIDTTYYVKTQTEKIDFSFLFHILKSMNLQALKGGAGIPGLNRNDVYRSKKIPLPALTIQRQIVIQIEKEQNLVNANKQLIEIFEKKIKDRIAKVWGEK